MQNVQESPIQTHVSKTFFALIFNRDKLDKLDGVDVVFIHTQNNSTNPEVFKPQ